jgi:hypothetical protein
MPGMPHHQQQMPAAANRIVPRNKVRPEQFISSLAVVLS